MNSTQPTPISLVTLVQSTDFEKWCHKAVDDTFKSLFAIDTQQKKTSATNDLNLDVSGIVAFVSEEIEAILQISCSSNTIHSLTKRIFADTEFNEKQILCLGEVVNIIFGILKENLNHYNLFYEKCLPIVVVGQNHLVLNLNKNDAFTSDYLTEIGLFNLKVSFNQKIKKALAS